MTPEEKYELFEKYCSKELSLNEKAMLDTLIKDKTVKKELELYAELHAHLDVNFGAKKEELALVDSLEKIGSNFFLENKQKQENIQKTSSYKKDQRSKVIKLPKWSYAVAASVAIIFGVYFFNQGDPVYNDFVSIPELLITQRGGVEEITKKAEKSFNTSKYSEAEKHLEQLLSEDPSNTKYQFYLGIALLEQDKYPTATQIFETLQNGNSVYKYRALWFEALNQLKQKNYDHCVEVLRRIPSEAEDYTKAKELLKELE